MKAQCHKPTFALRYTDYGCSITTHKNSNYCIFQSPVTAAQTNATSIRYPAESVTVCDFICMTQLWVLFMRTWYDLIMMHRRTNAAAYTDSAEMETPYVGVYAFIRSMSTTTPYGNCIIVSRKLSRLHTNTHNVICMYIIHTVHKVNGCH